MADDNEGTPPEGTPPAGDPPKARKAARSAPPDEGKLRELVAELVAEALEDLGDGGDGGDGAAPPPAGGAPASAAGVERDAEAQVRAAMGKIKAEEDTRTRIEKLEKVVTESAPAAVRRLTRFMWGSGDKK